MMSKIKTPGVGWEGDLSEFAPLLSVLFLTSSEQDHTNWLLAYSLIWGLEETTLKAETSIRSYWRKKKRNPRTREQNAKPHDRHAEKQRCTHQACLALGWERPAAAHSNNRDSRCTGGSSTRWARPRHPPGLLPGASPLSGGPRIPAALGQRRQRPSKWQLSASEAMVARHRDPPVPGPRQPPQRRVEAGTEPARHVRPHCPGRGGSQAGTQKLRRKPGAEEGDPGGEGWRGWRWPRSYRQAYTWSVCSVLQAYFHECNYSAPPTAPPLEASEGEGMRHEPLLTDCSGFFLPLGSKRLMVASPGGC